MFRCDLCEKSYARVTEYEGHTRSYDHQHRQRQKEARQMKRDGLRESRSDNREDQSTLRPIRMDEDPARRQASRGGFKKAFGSEDERAGSTAASMQEDPGRPQTALHHKEVTGEGDVSSEGSDEGSDEGYDSYDPANPTSP